MRLHENELIEVCEVIKSRLPQGGVVILQGDLASGKTTLVKRFAKSFGVSEAVTSPTFSLQQCYGDRLFHYDIYNHGLDHFISLGMLEELERVGYHLIEWGDATLMDILKSAAIPVIRVQIEKCERDKRCYEVSHV
ncbi:MAG: tRNA (adenosine(37)-N6)-threonylcarbamoyltransferase complex ATPase subunit type 1 TsaE [Campylobacterota bacterium]|nr:tRNA (adenosine(37)-N6)-threonylcarbamoyltransferase complex ATPase subunit type 1 TsaE [Campylobacterota bacterium]